MYCGDETGSFVGEVGSHTARFGYGGDDAPKFVVPSLCLPPPPTTSSITATAQPEGSEFTPGPRRRKKHTTLRLQRAASCYRWRGYSGADGGTDNDADDYRTPLRRARQMPESGAAAPQPIVDPDRFLSQGEAIDDWDAYASLWESAVDSLHVRDPSKHTSISTQSIRAHPTEHNAPGHSSTNLSTASGRSSRHQHEAGLAHPMLVIRPGFTHLYGSRGNIDQPPSEATAMEVDDSDTKLQEMSMDSKADTDLQQRHHQRAEVERLVELFMEDFGARAVFVAPAPMLAAFSHGRQTALVVDVGASGWCVLHVSRVVA
jgi:Actin